MEEGTHDRHSKRGEETDRRYSSWKKEHMRGIPIERKETYGRYSSWKKEHMIVIPKERRKQIRDIPVGSRST